MAENDGQGQACRQCGQPCDNVAGDPGRWAHALALDPLLPGVTSWYCAACVHGWQIALTDLREMMSPKNRQRFVMGGPMAFAGVYSVVEDALKVSVQTAKPLRPREG